MEAVPIFSRILKLQNEEPFLTDWEFVFKYPDEILTENQIKDLLDLCDFIVSKRSNKKMFFPGDEKSLYKLFVGAIFNIGESRNIYERLDIDFEFDGAIAETKGEIFYEHIIQKME